MSFLKNLFTVGKSPLEKFTPPPPPSDQSIALAEAVLAIKFPASFISIMREARPMHVPVNAGFYFVSDREGITAANQFEHARGSLPDFMVTFYGDGMSNHLCFDTRRRFPDGEYPIVYWDHELTPKENLAASEHAAGNSESAGIVAFSFSEWLNSLIE
jgi:hypothetical protein